MKVVYLDNEDLEDFKGKPYLDNDGNYDSEFYGVITYEIVGEGYEGETVFESCGDAVLAALDYCDTHKLDPDNFAVYERVEVA